ncbi:MAG: penicillin-binding transpeptidase domain-containing protein [Patescibacteria group bacterium]
MIHVRGRRRINENMFGAESSIWQEKTSKWRKGDLEDDGYVAGGLSLSRIYFFYLVSFLILLVFVARLFVLTVVAGARNRELADNNRVKLVEFEAGRGKIFDRRGDELASSKIAYFLKKDDKEREITETDAQNLEKGGRAGEYFEGVDGKVMREVLRKYNLGEAGAHVLGYTSVVQVEEKEQDKSLSTTNAMGRLGIEDTYDSFLLGKPGRRLVEVDAEGKNVSILGVEEARSGRDVYSTIDGGLQKVAYDSLKKYSDLATSKKGAVVVENPNTGEILALASAPSFDPEDIGRAVTDKNLPFFNRVVQGNYPPGSVFKIVSALAGLESGKVDANTEFDDTGSIKVGGQTFSNWFYLEYGKTDGLIKMKRAIARSNDVFFYKLGQEIGVDTIKQMAVKLGYGQKTAIDLPDESFGLVPDEVWKKAGIGESWFLGDTLHLAIGQGFMLTTPIQVNKITSYIASGKLTKPYLVSKINGGDGASEIKFEPKVVGENLVSQEHLDLVRAGMEGACEAGGTGAPFFNAKYRVACKTGTAEELGGSSHAWFTVYAPADKPEIALTVLVERGGQGSAVSAPVAKEILDWWFANRK